MSEDIGPARWINKSLGICLLAMAAFVGCPVGFAIYYDGIASVIDWPSLFNWLSAIAAMFLVAGLYLAITPQRVGGDIFFREGGLTVRIRTFFRHDEEHHFGWADIIEVEIIEAARNNDGMTISLKNGIKASFQTRYFEFGVAEILGRFRTSAEAAGYRLERMGGFNALIIEKQTWRVSPIS
jgi:hypothetical protein